jgi:hypothetical protein
VGLVIDAYTGRTFYGGKFGGPPKGRAGEIMTKMEIPSWLQGVSKEVWNRMAPLVIQDTIDALVDDGIPMAVTAGTLSFFGGGAQTYPMWASTQLKFEQEKQAKKYFKKPWDDLNERQQKIIRAMPDIKKLQLEKQKEKKLQGPPQIDWMLEEQDKVATEIQKQLPKSVQKKMDSLGIKVSAPSRRLGEFYLNDKRYEFYKKEYARQIKLLFSPGKSMPQSERIFDLRMNQAKAVSRNLLRKKIADGTL